MWIRTEQMRLSPSLPNDFIGKGLKRFLFCTVLVLHGCIFILPFLWYVVSAWLTPPLPKAIEVTLVAEPTADPQSSRGTRSATRKGTKNPERDVSAPDPGDLAEIPDQIPDTPDIPDVPKFKPRPPKKTKTSSKKPPVPEKNVPSAKPSPKTTVKPSPQKPEKKMTMEERIRAWRQQHGKTIKVPRNTGTAKGNSNAQTMNRLAQDVEGLIGNGGSGDRGAGGVFDSYVPLLIEFIQREWKRVAPNDMGTKVIVPLYFEIDGRGNVLRSSIRKRSGIPVLDAAVEAMLRSMRRLPAPPDGKRQSFTVNLRVGELL